jgi:hypothetical protein
MRRNLKELKTKEQTCGARKNELEARRLDIELRRLEDDKAERIRREQEASAEKEQQLRQCSE